MKDMILSKALFNVKDSEREKKKRLTDSSDGFLHERSRWMKGRRFVDV